MGSRAKKKPGKALQLILEAKSPYLPGEGDSGDEVNALMNARVVRVSYRVADRRFEISNRDLLRDKVELVELIEAL